MLSLADNVQHRLWRVIGWLRYQFLERNRPAVIRNGLVIGCLVLTLISGVLMSARPIFGLGLVGGIGGLLFLLFIYRNMETACLLLLPVTTFLNFGVGTGTGTPITLSFVLIISLFAAWMIRLLVIERSFKSVLPGAPNWLIIIFAVIVLISLIWGNLYVEPPIRQMMEDKLNPRLMTAAVFILSPAVTLIVANFIRSIRAMKVVVWWFVVYGGLIAALRLTDLGWPSFFNARGQLGVWTAVLALGQVFYNTRLKPWQRVGLLTIPVVWVYIQLTLGRTWLSGWVPVVIGFIGMTFLYSRKLFVLVCIIAVVFALVNIAEFQRIFEAESIESGNTRVTAWDQTIQVVRDHFLFGTGPAGYYFYLYIYVGGFFQLSHNNYVDVIAQTGVLGFAVYIALWLSIGWITLKTYFIAPKIGFLRGLANSLLVIYGLTLVVMMLGDWVIPFPYTQTLAGISYTIWAWMFAGMSIGLYHYCKASISPAAIESET
jgi:O-antigen ligase